jgi:hypothetical protein
MIKKNYKSFKFHMVLLNLILKRSEVTDNFDLIFNQIFNLKDMFLI